MTSSKHAFFGGKLGLEQKETDKLFSYGTLRAEAVQLATFGRTLEGKPDVLVRYSLKMIRIQDQDFVALSGAEYHRTIRFTGQTSDIVEGTLLAVTEKELEQADSYEPEGYERVRVGLKSGTRAWVYVNTGESQ